MNKYTEYFDIDQEYFPEINESSIKAGVDWQKTFPHKTFIDLLKATERMLARSTNSDKKGIWIEGAYGTGKSRVAWTLKNLLDCPSDALTSYFSEYPALQKEPDLRDKLLGHKKGKIITVYRYASGSISGDRALIMAIYESVTKALRDAGIAYKGENTLRGSVATWLSDEINKKFFDTLISLPEYRGLGSFAGKTADDVINLLKNTGANVDALMNDIFMLAESRGITALTINMDDLITWLTEIIDQNSLKAIVFIWDEFSAYFKINKTALDEFQKLAELSNLKPFYLMIVTHMSGSLFSDNDQSGIIVRDRFVRKEIELPDSIAFELIRHALKVKDAQRDIWEKLADDLNSRMPFSREAVRKSVWKTSDAGNDVLKGMLPLHPLAALLLKNISSAFASNQRSMFNFIKNAETADLQAFQWFIDNYSPDNADILTIDFLWSFFYERGTDEYGTGAGRSNLDSIIRTILDTFPLNESRLFADDKRVLKTILMMQAISQKLGDSVDLFLPTDQNLNLAFEGTDLEDNRAINLAKKLVKDGILYFKPLSGGKFQYAAAAVSGDQAQVEIIKKRIVSETKTAALLASGDLMLALQLSPALRFRYDVRIVSVETFTSIVNKITNEPKSYKIRAILSFARNDDEQNKVRELIKTAIRDERYRELVFIDSSSSVLGGERFGQWVDCAANEEYWRNKDGKLADEMSRKARAILEGWRTDIANGSFTVYSMYATTGEPYSSAASAMIALANITIRRYPLSFDNAKVSEQMFAQLGLQSGAKCGISQSCGGVFQQSFIVPLMQGAWQIDKYWESAPALPLSKLKLKVNELIEQGFSKDGRIAFSTIFDMLMNLGFMPCNLYALITGFLLKEFSTDPYRYSDGETGDKMSIEKLAEIISEYIKHKSTPIPRYREKYIVVQTREQIAFAKFANTVFGVPENISIEQMAARIRLKLKDLGYPIWCFKESDTQVLDAFVDKLSALATPNNIGESVAKTAAALGKMSLDMPAASGMLLGLLTKPNAARAMAKFLESFENGDLLTLAAEISAKDVLLDVMLQIGSGETLWLWDKETGEEEIRKLTIDYRIVAASNRINASVTSLSDCLKEWCNRAKSVKIPCAALITEMPKLKTFFRILQDIFSSGELTYDKRQSFISELELNSNAIMNFFATKTDVFRSVYSFYLTGFSDSEIAVLYSKLPMTSFAMEKSECEEKVAQLAEKMREDQDKYQLHRIWEEATSSKTPKDWSRMHRTPVLCLIPLRVQNDFQRIFRAINNSNPEGSEIKFSLEFLHSQPTLLNELLAVENIDAAFIRDIIGRFVAVLPCPDDVRDRLESVVSLEPYDWYGNPAVLREVEKFAQSRYNQGGSAKALVRIEKMDDRKAKDYLKRLIIDNMNVGIEIISEGD